LLRIQRLEVLNIGGGVGNDEIDMKRALLDGMRYNGTLLELIMKSNGVQPLFPEHSDEHKCAEQYIMRNNNLPNLLHKCNTNDRLVPTLLHHSLLCKATGHCRAAAFLLRFG